MNETDSVFDGKYEPYKTDSTEFGKTYSKSLLRQRDKMIKLFMGKEERIRQLASDMDYGCTKRDLYPDDAKEIAKALDILGYRKIVWYKVAEGDLPNDNQEIRWVDITNNYYNGIYCANDTQQFHADVGCHFNKDEVIAWTELPIYNE